MANVLNEEKKQQVLALGRLGWSLRQIQAATRIRRETASQYWKAAGIAVRPPGGWGRRAAKAANEVITGSAVITDRNPSQPDPAPAKAISRRPSDRRPSSRDTACSTAKLTPCSTNWPTPRSMACAKNPWSFW